MSPSKVNWVSWRRLGKLLWKIFLVLIIILLLWWTFRQVPIKQVWVTLRQLNLAQIFIWLLVNIGLVILMTGRWGLVLRSLGQTVSLFALVRYRLASFAISYFTPGPQFGGEPVQVLALRHLHNVPGTTGTASVGLDRLLDLIANFSFLVFGVAVLLSQVWLPSGWGGAGLLFGLGLLVIPLIYLVLMLVGRTPLSGLIDHLPQSIAQNWVTVALRQVEAEMSAFCVGHPGSILQASLLSILIWGGMVFEYWLLTFFLGLRLSLLQVISALTAARLALLTPLPGGLGALEASQVLALQSLGLEPGYGITVALLIRFRDILLSLIGLLGVLSLLRKPDPQPAKGPKDV